MEQKRISYLEALGFIKENLLHGDMQKIAEKAKVSYSLTYRALHKTESWTKMEKKVILTAYNYVSNRPSDENYITVEA